MRFKLQSDAKAILYNLIVFLPDNNIVTFPNLLVCITWSTTVIKSMFFCWVL